MSIYIDLYLHIYMYTCIIHEYTYACYHEHIYSNIETPTSRCTAPTISCCIAVCVLVVERIRVFMRYTYIIIHIQIRIYIQHG